VLCHALIDALAGALAEGDLGDHFPADSDPAAQGARSLDYVPAIAARVRERGFAVENVDSYVTHGSTRLGPHLAAMRANLEQALGVGAGRVSVKARSGGGFLGGACSADVAVLLVSA
jgi:2-C-methyl-D-erythritol 2,4-cyclodiphosphate synthase